MFASLQEVEQYRLPGLELLNNKMIDLAVGTLAAFVTSSWSDEAVAAKVRIVEPMAEVAGLSNVEEFTASYE